MKQPKKRLPLAGFLLYCLLALFFSTAIAVTLWAAVTLLDPVWGNTVAATAFLFMLVKFWTQLGNRKSK